MATINSAKFFGAKANVYLEMMGFVSDDGQRRILHELFEENEGKADQLEEMTVQLSPPGGRIYTHRPHLNLMTLSRYKILMRPETASYPTTATRITTRS
jgi:hypothetical protein